MSHRERIIAAHERLLDRRETGLAGWHVGTSQTAGALAGIVGSLAAICDSRIEFAPEQMRELISNAVEREINQVLRPAAVEKTEADE